MSKNLKPVEINSLSDSKKRISGVFSPPSDKSITHRAIFLSALSAQPSKIERPLLSGDCVSTLRAFKSLGVPIRVSKTRILVSKGTKNSETGLRILRSPKTAIDCGNSGTTLRILSGILAAQDFCATLVGDASLSKRPMQRVVAPLTQMGAQIKASKGAYPPLKIKGTSDLKPISWESPVASAQVKSSILFAGLFAKGKTRVQEPVRSRDHTERMLEELGVKIQFRKDGALNLSNQVSVTGPCPIRGLNLTVPGDFSSASFFIAAALLVPNSRLKIKNVNLNPTRVGFLNVLMKMGAKIAVKNKRVIFNEPVGDLEIRSSSLTGVRVQPGEIPWMIDEIPILAVVATQSRGKTVISGAEELRVKESDRLHALYTELSKMGAEIEEKKDGFVIKGPVFLKGMPVESYHDHRIAMSLAIAGLIARGKTRVRNFDCVQISFPNFLTSLHKLIR